MDTREFLKFSPKKIIQISRKLSRPSNLRLFVTKTKKFKFLSYKKKKSAFNTTLTKKPKKIISMQKCCAKLSNLTSSKLNLNLLLFWVCYDGYIRFLLDESLSLPEMWKTWLFLFNCRHIHISSIPNKTLAIHYSQKKKLFPSCNLIYGYNPKKKFIDMHAWYKYERDL